MQHPFGIKNMLICYALYLNEPNKKNIIYDIILFYKKISFNFRISLLNPKKFK